MTNQALHRQSSPKGRLSTMFGTLVKLIVPLAVSVGLCVLMFREINFHSMMALIREQCHFRWIGLMLAMAIVPMILRALRWGIQLRASGINAPVHSLIYSIVGCYSLNLVFPRLGEVWRTGYIAWREDARFPMVFGSMIADRMADLIAVGLLTLATFAIARDSIIDFVRAYPETYRMLGQLLTSPIVWIVAVSACSSLTLFLTLSKSTLAIKARQFIAGLWEGFAAIRHMRNKWAWLGLTIGIWGCYFLQMVISFNAFPVLGQMLTSQGLIMVLVCYVLTSIAMGIPSHNGIGPYQTTLLFGLNIFLPAFQQWQVAHGVPMISNEQFQLTGAAFGNIIIAGQTMLLIVLGLIVFLLVALDKRHKKSRIAREAYPRGLNNQHIE